MSTLVKRAVCWLLRSGVYVLSQDDAQYGAVYSYYDARHGHCRLIYAEATGYVLSFLRNLHAASPEERLTAAARASGDWLLRAVESRNGAVSMGFQGADEIPRAYAFDNGICCRGLLDVYELTGDARYLTGARRIAEWLMREALNRDGSVNAVLDLDSGRFVNGSAAWYTASGSFHAKIAIPLLQLYAVSGERPCRDAALSMCEWALARQRADGAFPANVVTSSVNLHAHCYTVEALLYAYAIERRPSFLEAAERAVGWAIARQRRDGSLPLWHGGRLWAPRASYAIAQIVRLCVLLHAWQRRSYLVEAAERAAGFLAGMQVSSDDPRTDGGFLGQDAERAGIRIRRNAQVTSWATMFAAQALDLVERSTSLDFDDGVRRLF